MKSKLSKKLLQLKKINNSVEFERYYGNERKYGEAIMKEQMIKDKVLKLIERKKKYKK